MTDYDIILTGYQSTEMYLSATDWFIIALCCLLLCVIGLGLNCNFANSNNVADEIGIKYNP